MRGAGVLGWGGGKLEVGAMDVRSSDHKPVCGIYQDKIRPRKEEKVIQDLVCGWRRGRFVGCVFGGVVEVMENKAFDKNPMCGIYQNKIIPGKEE